MAGFDFLSGDSWMPAAVSLAGGLLGSQSTDSSSSSTRSMDPRMDRYVYGADGQSGLLSDAFGLYSKQASQGGLNDLQRQGMGMQQQYLMSPQYQQGYANMASLGNALMSGGVAGNPFISGGSMGGVSFGGGSPAAAYSQAPVIRGNQQQLPAFNYDWSQIPGTGMAKLPDYKSTPVLLSPANQQVVNQLNAGAANGGGGGGGNATGNGGGFSIGVGQMTDAINSSALSAAQRALALGLPAAAIAGLYSQYAGSHGFMDAINQAADPLGALAAAQGWTDTDPGYNAWGGGYSDSGGGWGNGGYGFGGGTGGMGD